MPLTPHNEPYKYLGRSVLIHPFQELKRNIGIVLSLKISCWMPSFSPSFFQSVKVHGPGILIITEGHAYERQQQISIEGCVEVCREKHHKTRKQAADEKRDEADIALLLPAEPGASYEHRHIQND